MPDDPFGSLRDPYPTEAQFFKTNPHVAGMATEDNRVILNPYRQFTPAERNSVLRNERIRLLIRNKRIQPPGFGVSAAQQQQLGSYPGAQNDLLATIAARIAAGDPSVGHATPEQSMYVNQNVLPMLQRMGW